MLTGVSENSQHSCKGCKIIFQAGRDIGSVAWTGVWRQHWICHSVPLPPPFFSNVQLHNFFHRGSPLHHNCRKALVEHQLLHGFEHLLCIEWWGDSLETNMRVTSNLWTTKLSTRLSVIKEIHHYALMGDRKTSFRQWESSQCRESVCI
jgi:hypothetical protein